MNGPNFEQKADEIRVEGGEDDAGWDPHMPYIPVFKRHMVITVQTQSLTPPLLPA